MESYPGRFPFPETHPGLSLSSPPISVSPVSAIFFFLRFRRFRPPQGVPPSPEERLLPPSTPAALVFHDLAGKPRIEAKTTPAAVWDFCRFSAIPATSGPHFFVEGLVFTTDYFPYGLVTRFEVLRPDRIRVLEFSGFMFLV